MLLWRILRWGLVAVGVLVLLVQVVPYGRAHNNPPVIQEPAWDSPRTRELAVRACYDCHSNETVWPWYSNVAPVSWLVQRHTEEGRGELNFSEWGIGRQKTNKADEIVQAGEMPPAYYTPLHASARLTPAERDELIRGLRLTVGKTTP